MKKIMEHLDFDLKELVGLSVAEMEQYIIENIQTETEITVSNTGVLPRNSNFGTWYLYNIYNDETIKDEYGTFTTIDITLWILIDTIKDEIIFAE